MRIEATAHQSRTAGSMATDVERPWLLAIDTSTGQAGIALFDGERLAALSWPGGRTQTTSVLPAIDEMLVRLDLTLDGVGAVAVAIGPGSFTGLRVGLSLAKGLAMTGDRVAIGVPTLDVMAEPCAATGVSCAAAIPAGRGRVVWAHYPTGREASPASNTTFDEFVVAVSGLPETLVIGELSREWQDHLASSGIRMALATLGLQRAGVLAQIGYRRWERGEIDDAVAMEPLYLHGRPNPR